MNEFEHTFRTSLRALADDAGAPAGQATADRAIARSHRDRRRRAGFLAATAAGAVVAAAAVTTAVIGPAREVPVAAEAESTSDGAPAPATEAAGPSGDPTPTPTGDAVGGVMAADCVDAYSPAAVAGRAFAFDGTVTAIGPASSNRPGAVLGLAAVTFDVHTWFTGGSGDVVTVDMGTPAGGPTSESTPPYELGTRLLVSGEPRWGGAPLDSPIAWGCGFTRPHDAQTAAAWATATATD